MSRFMSRRFAGLEEYTPGEQPKDKQYIKLNTNESPFPPSPGTLAALAGGKAEQLNLYPDPDCRTLAQAVAERYGVEENQVFLSNGSDDILNFAFMAFCDKTHPVLFPEISYGFYEVYANLHLLPYRKVPMHDGFAICPADYYDAKAMVVLANPNAQTGLALSRQQIAGVVAANPDSVVLIDEAYVDFGCESALPLVAQFGNLLVVQTFSKSRSMAGARLGFAIGSAPLIADLNKLKYSTNPYNLNRLTQAAGAAALHDAPYYRKNCDTIMENRAYTRQQLLRRGFTVTDSTANFLLAGDGPVEGGALYRALKARGILVRHFDSPQLSNYIRITIGTRAQMDALLAAVDAILEEKQ